MDWQKLGRLFWIDQVDKTDEFTSHCSNPLPVFLEGNIFRVFYNRRDLKNRSNLFYFDFDIETFRIVNRKDTPLLSYSEFPKFCKDGVSLGGLYEINGDKYILFMGWQTDGREHWRGDIGRLKLSKDLGSVVYSPREAFIECDDIDRVSLSYPCVINSGGQYHMWYGSTLNWSSVNGEMVHVLNSAVSNDGINWKKRGLAIPYKIGSAQAFSRPTLLVDKQNCWHMWFSYRAGDGEKYRIGYAISPDQNYWEIKDSNLYPSKSGWDSEMICYPWVFTHEKSTYMLYNGNEHGKTGIGIAKLTDDEAHTFQ